MTLAAAAPLGARQRRRHKLRNFGQSLLLLGGMVLLLAACGWIVAGALGLVVTILMGGIGLSLGAGASPRLVLQLYGARELPRDELAEVHSEVQELSRRAGLAEAPKLFYISSPTLNAFSVGTRDEAVIAMTSGLLSRLSLRELAAVLAHELSHVRSDDMWVMALADLISRMTRSMSFLGVLLLAINAPLWLVGAAQLPGCWCFC